MAIDRMCASGLVAIATAAKGIMTQEYTIAVAGGLESISLVQNKHKNAYRAQSEAVLQAEPTAYIQMIETAELVAQRYGISRADQDAYALRSQQRTAAAQRAGLFADEIVPLATRKALFDKEGQLLGHEDTLLAQDEGNRADTTLDSLSQLKPVPAWLAMRCSKAGAAACVTSSSACALAAAWAPPACSKCCKARRQAVR